MHPPPRNLDHRRRRHGSKRPGQGAALLLITLLVALGWWLQDRSAPVAPPVSERGSQAAPANDRSSPPRTVSLPAEAQETLALIARGGPFPHPQDGGVFGNREGHLPDRARGYYREYTVATPGLGHRGSRRIVTGGTPPAFYYYTDDHYESFRSFEPPR